MSIIPSYTQSDFESYAKYLGFYYNNKYKLTGQSSVSSSDQKVGGLIPGLDVALALIGAGTSLCSGIKNLKSSNEDKTNVNVSISNCTSYIMTAYRAGTHYPEISSRFTKPSQSTDVIFTDRLGSYYSSNPGDIYLSFVSIKDPDDVVNLVLRLSDETDSDTSRLVQINGIAEGYSDNPSFITNDTGISYPASNVSGAVWTITLSNGTDFYVRGSAIASDNMSKINVTILEKAELL
ncbi:hypothetical protein [Klebsiella aerogenes]|uniref:hypothetical protein n=1 Tax=Klebsiella aerogenes TaxID=548 RepID=UPI0021D33CFE|nr:hypothetical protein [Klebsiella aerogenes]MCU6317974.1 hypothetical protein [Klebsiella aerogenes]